MTLQHFVMSLLGAYVLGIMTGTALWGLAH